MNILQINTIDNKGGAAKVAYSLKQELKTRGHNITFVVSKKYSNDNNVKLIRPYSNLRQRILKKLTYYLANDLDFFGSDRILKMPEFKSADIVHCHNLHTNYFNLSTLQKISAIKPAVWTFHDMWPITAHCGHAFDGPLKENGFFTCPSLDIYPPIAWHNEKYLESKKEEIYKNSNFNIVTPSKWLADKVNQSILKDKPLTVIYNGINMEVFKPQDKKTAREELELPQDKKIILTVAKGGKANPWKGWNYIQEVMDAFKDKNEIEFVNLGGEGAYISDPEILSKYYSASDILLYPSIADNCPLVVLEALACRLPVVAFNTGGMPELINHKVDGYIAEYKNTNDIINGLEFVLNSQITPTTEERFTIKKMTDQYIELYKSLL